MVEVRYDYRTWIRTPARARSPEVDFGVWWKLLPVEGSSALASIPYGSGAIVLNASFNRRWRVSWIEDTGELYAKQQTIPKSDIMIVLGHFPTREAVEQRMEGWADSRVGQVLLTFFAAEFMEGEGPL